jgi:hypothetical protein
MTKIAVKRCYRDVELLKLHLNMVSDTSSLRRRELAAKIHKPDPTFQEETSRHVIRFLFGSIAAANHVTPADRTEIKKMFRSRKAARQAIEAACLAWQRYDGLHDDLNKALETVKQHERFAANNLEQLKKLKRGVRPYSAFDNLIRALAKQYTLATGQKPIINLNMAREYNDRCSGTFAELLEECFDQSKKIWNASGFEKRLPAPIHKGGRLEHARKALLQK